MKRVCTFKEVDSVCLRTLISSIDVGRSTGPEAGDETLLGCAALWAASPEDADNRQCQSITD